MPSIRELLHANLHDVFGNRDGVARLEAIDRTYAEDVVFTDPEGTIVGRSALAAKAAAVLDGAPDEFVFVEDSIPYEGDGIGAMAWAFGPAGSPVVRGLDLLTIRDGFVSAVHVLVVEAASAPETAS